MHPSFDKVISIFLFLLFLAQAASALERKTTVNVVYEALSPSNSVIWLPLDQGLYEKYGLDVKVIHARGATPVQALVSGAVEFGAIGGAAAIAANLRGSDLALVAGKPNFAVSALWTRNGSPIKSLKELRGKTIGTTAPGSSNHMIARLALRRVGLTDKDVMFLHYGSLPEVFLALDRGLIDAATGSAPRPGFRQLVDLSGEKIPFLMGAIVAQRSLVQRQRQMVLRFLKAYVEAIKLAKEKPELAAASIVRQLKMKPEVAAVAYRSWAGVWEEVPYVRTESVQAILDLYPKEAVKNIKAEQFIDNSLVQELGDSGFFKELYQR